MGPSGLLRRTYGYTCTSDDAAPPLLGSEPNDIAEVGQALESLPAWAIRLPTRAGWAASCCSAECKESVEATESGLNMVVGTSDPWPLGWAVVMWRFEGLNGARAFRTAPAA